MTQDPAGKDAKAKFREALEKKKGNQKLKDTEGPNALRVSGNQSAGKPPKMFRRKTGGA